MSSFDGQVAVVAGGASNTQWSWCAAALRMADPKW